MALVISSLHPSTSRPGWLEPAGPLVFRAAPWGAVLTEFAYADIIYYYTGNNIRVEAEPAIADCRIPGYVAARICDPHARPCAP